MTQFQLKINNNNKDLGSQIWHLYCQHFQDASLLIATSVGRSN